MQTKKKQHILIPNLNVNFYNDPAVVHLMETRGILLENETTLDVFKRVLETLLYYDARELDHVCLDFVKRVVDYTSSGIFAFGTPILTNAGRNSAPTTACTVLSVPKINNRFDKETFRKKSFFMLNQAIGVGYDLSQFEDPVAVLREMNEEIRKINEHLKQNKQRPAACMATLQVNHPKILDFIKTKDTVDFAHWTFNISVLVTEELFTKAKKDQSIELIDFQTSKKVGTLKAKTVLEKIASSAHTCGEPGVLFIDRFQAGNPTPKLSYLSTAPCAEVALAEGEFCQFSYINLKNLYKKTKIGATFDYATFGVAVQTLTRLIDSSVTLSIESLKKSNQHVLLEQKRRIGIGVTGFAELLVNLSIPFASDAALRLAGEIGELLSYHTLVESVTMAKTRGYFPAYHESKMTERHWFEKRSQYFSGIVSDKKWQQVINDTLRYGVRNASLVSFPPTGTSSQLVQTTTSFEPFFSLTNPISHTQYRGETVNTLYSSVEMYLKKRHTQAEYENIVDTIYTDGMLHSHHSENQVLVTAKQIKPIDHLKIQAQFQNFSDESSSKTINLSNTATKEEVLDCIWQSYDLNLKGFTVFRDGCLSERKL